MGYLVDYSPATGSLMAAGFDAKRLEVKGAPVRVLDGVQGTNGPFGAFAFSDSGTLAYLPGAAGRADRLALVDRQGSKQVLRFPPRAYRNPRLSPEGERVAVDIGESTDVTQRADIWVLDLARGTERRITSENVNSYPVWAPDGKRVIYLSGRAVNQTALVSAPADGSSPPPVHPVSEPGLRYLSSVSPKGDLVIGRSFGGAGESGNAFWVLPLREGSPALEKPQPFLDSRFRKADPQFSPDGGWLAYDASDTGSSQIYVTPYPGPGATYTISIDGGVMPRWARSGRELFYQNGGKMMVVEVQTNPVFQAKTPRELFTISNAARRAFSNPLGVAYDVSRDGQHFLMVEADAESLAPSDQLHIVVNWFEELRRRVPPAK
jgi:Tol biopolymer transport system component